MRPHSQPLPAAMRSGQAGCSFPANGEQRVEQARGVALFIYPVSRARLKVSLMSLLGWRPFWRDSWSIGLVSGYGRASCRRTAVTFRQDTGQNSLPCFPDAFSPLCHSRAQLLSPILLSPFAFERAARRPSQARGGFQAGSHSSKAGHLDLCFPIQCPSLNGGALGDANREWKNRSLHIAQKGGVRPPITIPTLPCRA
jgi:hypothetical protein